MKKQITTIVLYSVAIATPLRLSAQGISSVDIYKNYVYTQTSGSAPNAPSGYFADVELTSIDNNDFDTVTALFPGATSATSIPQGSPTFFSYGPSFSTLSAMNSAVPFGTYSYSASNSMNGDNESVDLNYSTDAFGSATPALAAATFNALSGLDPTQALTIGFDSFTPDVNATQGFTFFSISDTMGNVVFTDGFLDPASTSLLLPAGTLMPNTMYNFELDFSDRQIGSTSSTGGNLGVGTTIGTLIGSDLRDDGSFTTGAVAVTPEPGTILLLAAGLVAIGSMRSRRRPRD